MNKVSSLDIRVAVLACSFVPKELETDAPKEFTPVLPRHTDERIVSLFLNCPKATVELPTSKIPLAFRRGRFFLVKIIEILKTLLQEKQSSNVLAEIFSDRGLSIPQLPHPPFISCKPPRFFWHPAYQPCDEYSPDCLISETKEATPVTVFDSIAICTHARHVLPKEGVLRQDESGFVYLELSPFFITTFFPRLQDQDPAAASFQEFEPSPAHVPVILPHEWTQKKGWGEIAELEKAFSFDIVKLCSIKPKNWPGIERVYFLELSSPALRQLRESHLLPSLIRGHPFHVAIACKKANPAAKASPGIFRLNVSCHAA